MSTYGPTHTEIQRIHTALAGWSTVGGYGPKYFLSGVEADDMSDSVSNNADDSSILTVMARQLTAVHNFHGLFEEDRSPLTLTDFTSEAHTFLLTVRTLLPDILHSDFFGNDTALPAQLFKQGLTQAAAVIYVLGTKYQLVKAFRRAHACLKMAKEQNCSVLEHVRAGWAGFFSCCQFHPSVHRSNNLISSPVAAALCKHVLDNVREPLQRCCQTYDLDPDSFRDTLIDAVATIDYHELQEAPFFATILRKIASRYGRTMTDWVQQSIAVRHSMGSLLQPRVSGSVLACLGEQKLDTGFYGLTGDLWTQMLKESFVEAGPDERVIFHNLLQGTLDIEPSQRRSLRKSLLSNRSAILRAQVAANTILHDSYDIDARADRTAAWLRCVRVKL